MCIVFVHMHLYTSGPPLQLENGLLGYINGLILFHLNKGTIHLVLLVWNNLKTWKYKITFEEADQYF